MVIGIKNCGMQTAEAIDAAASSGAEFIGFIHYPKSARHIEPQDAARLSANMPDGLKAVAVLVNPTNEQIAHIKALGYADWLQLHGDERPERVLAIKEQTALPVIKAIGVSTKQDLAELATYEAVADMLLLDTKSAEYGGTGTAFDWSLLANIHFSKPWFLSGGLNADNLERALHQTGAQMIDVSSGIEHEKGVKDIDMIQRFNQRALRYER